MSIWSELKAGIITRSPEEMAGVAARLGPVLPETVTLALHGSLGVGKTTFTAGLARALGVAVPVTSPTFQLYSIYDGKDRRLIHLDAYRLETSEAAEDLLLEDYCLPPYVLVVEWAEKIREWLPPPVMNLHFRIHGDNQHQIQGGPERGAVLSSVR